MARRTKAEIIKSLEDAIAEVSPQLRVDADKGAFFNLSIRSTAVVLAEENENVERIAKLASFQFPEVATEEERIGSANAFSVGRSEGGFAYGEAVFYTSTRPQGSEEFIVAESDSASTALGNGVVFLATETRSLNEQNADLFYNPQTRRYELPVPMRAARAGAESNISARSLRYITSGAASFDGVTNFRAFEGGAEREDAEKAYRRTQQRLLGLDQLSVGGLKSKIAEVDVDRVLSVEFTYSTEYPHLYYRLPDSPGVDAIVQTIAKPVTILETFIATGGESQIVLSQGPVLSLANVLVNSSPVSATLILDTSPAFGRSTRESSVVSLPTPLEEGDVVEVSYSIDETMTKIQTVIDGVVGGGLFSTDVLVRYPRVLEVSVEITGTVIGSADRDSLEESVASAAIAYIRDGVEGSEGRRTAAELRDAVRTAVPNIASLAIPVFCRKQIGNIVEIIDIPRNAVPVLNRSDDLVVRFI